MGRRSPFAHIVLTDAHGRFTIAVMRGRVFRRDGKRWAFMIDVGPDPAKGRRRQQMRSGFPTRKEAEQAMRELLAVVEQGTYVARSVLTVGEFLDEWLVTLKPRLRETTWYGSSVAVRRLAAQIGAVKLQALTPLEIERV